MRLKLGVIEDRRRGSCNQIPSWRGKTFVNAYKNTQTEALDGRFSILANQGMPIRCSMAW
jgi:hypothetical protein